MDDLWTIENPSAFLFYCLTKSNIPIRSISPLSVTLEMAVEPKRELIEFTYCIPPSIEDDPLEKIKTGKFEFRVDWETNKLVLIGDSNA